MNKARHADKWTEPAPTPKTRDRAYDEVVRTNETGLPEMYATGTVTFWSRWYYTAHDEEALVRWEERLGLGHDPIEGWDNRFQQQRPAYPAQGGDLTSE